MSNKEKREFAISLLRTEQQFDVLARTGAPNVIIPDYLQREPYVTLTFGKGLPTPILDLSVDQYRLTGTLHFGSVGHFWCLVRWEAVQAINAPSGAGRVWLGESVRETESKPDVHVQGARKAPHLRLIQGGKCRTTPSGGAA